MNAGLADLQRLFQDRLLAGGNDIERHLKDRGPFLKVYDHAYLARLLEVMGEDFPAVHTLLGDDQFGDAAVAFVRAHPSRARSIRWLGAGFSAWLREADPWRNLLVVADMAAFEWALGLAFDAPDSEPVGMPALAAVPVEAWPGLRFEFHRSLNIVRLAVDVAPFQRAVAAERDPEAAPEPLSEPGDWGVWRDLESLQVRYRPLPVDEAAGLDCLRTGGDFAALCEVLAEFGEPDAAAVRAAGLLKAWLEAGWLTDLSADGLSWA